MYVTPALREFPPEFCIGGGVQKTGIIPLSDGGKSLTICALVSIQYRRVTDRRTDGFDITISRSACIGMLTRGKKVV